MQQLLELYKEWKGSEPAAVQQLPGAGSNRVYYRLTDNEGQSVVVIEDLVSTGKSSLIAVNALRERGCVVKGMVAIFTYGWDVAAKNFEDAKVELHTLTNYDTLIEVACQEEYIRAADQESLANWRKNPEAWSDAHMA